MHKLFLKLLKKTNKIITAIIQKLQDNHGVSSKEVAAYEIAGINELGNLIFQVKPETIERIYPLRILDLIRGGYIDFLSPAQSFYSYKNALVFPYSDFIITENKAVWHKFHNPIFIKNFPQDKSLIKREGNKLYIDTSHEVINIKKAISLCGVYADVWSHFMIQYLPKLYYSKEVAGLYGNEITLIIPDYKDLHLLEVFETFITQYEKIKIQVLQDDQVALCEELIYIESATTMIDHEQYVSLADMIIPEKVAEVLKEQLVGPMLNKHKIKKNKTKYKLFIQRKDATYRNLQNNEEIEAFFKNIGFTMIEPHLLNLDEKIELFYNADIVVGPYSSGFSNLVFSQSKTKVLVFTNLQRAFEPYFPFFSKYFDLEFLTVTGEDADSSNSHSAFFIPIEKIKRAFNELINSSTQNQYDI